MQGERLVGGLWCGEVLALLSDYVDGELETAERAGVEAHLGGCAVCERFGGDYGKLIARIRASMLSDPELGSPAAARRLRQRIRDEIEPG